MMIVERMRDHMNTLRFKACKKALRIANRCDGMYPHTGEARDGLFVPIGQRTHYAAAKQHEHLACFRIAAIADAKIDGIKAAQWFAQWPSR